MNNQEIFTAVKNHLLTQMQKSEDELDYCRYHSPTGLKCAVGVFFTPEEAYRYEGKSVYDVRVMETLESKGITSLELLYDLQQIHDASPPDMWESKLRYLAVKYDLKY